MGAEPDKGGINPQNMQAMQNLFKNESVGRVLVSDFTTKAQFIIPDISKVVGPSKYEVINNDIKDGLQNIIVGDERYSNTQVKAQIFLERLKESRNAFIYDFLQPQIKMVCKNMGLKSYPVAKFDITSKFPGHDLIDKYSPEDLASWVQHKFEEHFIFVLQRLSNKTKNLCLAGGCALNISLNSRIIEEGIFEDVHVNPGPNDDGLSSGVALYLANRYENQIILPANLGCLGIKYQDEDYKIVLDRAFSKGISFDDFDLNMIVDCLLKNKIIAWFQDGSEFGPRALGNRSILANPTVDNKDYLNEKIKYREYWRPYAPIMLEQYLHDWFDIPKKTSPYMLFNARLKEEKNGLVPAITHVDNTARVQTVNSDQNKKVFDLLTAFCDKTEIPMLLNTSFNIKGEPIVETPMDALNTFIDSDIDYLVIGDNVLWR